VNILLILQVAWVRVDTQTILTIHTHVITRSHRIGLSHTDSWTWNLHIRNVKETDRGFYMCQINTDPMMSQNGYLQVVGEFFVYVKEFNLRVTWDWMLHTSLIYLEHDTIIFYANLIKHTPAEILL